MLTQGRRDIASGVALLGAGAKQELAADMCVLYSSQIPRAEGLVNFSVGNASGPHPTTSQKILLNLVLGNASGPHRCLKSLNDSTGMPCIYTNDKGDQHSSQPRLYLAPALPPVASLLNS